MMPRLLMRGLDDKVSKLGFGCASLGSRIPRRKGLQALTRAFDVGVTWFDVAPSYGDGQAELLLGEFARSRRQLLQIVTKIGLSPPMPTLMQRLARPPLQAVLAAVPQVRTIVRRRRPAATKVELSAAFINESLERSLRRLQTDYVDVLALHAVEPHQATDPEIISALESIVARGTARLIGIASTPRAAAIGMRKSGVYGLAQFANNPFETGIEEFRSYNDECDVATVTHSAFGGSGGSESLINNLSTDQALFSAFLSAGYTGTIAQMAADYLADYAIDSNPNGVVVMSMFKPSHLTANVARFESKSLGSYKELKRLCDPAPFLRALS